MKHMLTDGGPGPGAYNPAIDYFDQPKKQTLPIERKLAFGTTVKSEKQEAEETSQ
jgi:hypothetical protein